VARARGLRIDGLYVLFMRAKGWGVRRCAYTSCTPDPPCAGVPELHPGHLEWYRRRDRPQRRHRRFCTAWQPGLSPSLLSRVASRSLSGPHVPDFGSQTLVLGSFAAPSRFRDRWQRFCAFVCAFVCCVFRWSVFCLVACQMPPGLRAGPGVRLKLTDWFFRHMGW
jgi:hypothetical protein